MYYGLATVFENLLTIVKKAIRVHGCWCSSSGWGALIERHRLRCRWLFVGRAVFIACMVTAHKLGTCSVSYSDACMCQSTCHSEWKGVDTLAASNYTNAPLWCCKCMVSLSGVQCPRLVKVHTQQESSLTHCSWCIVALDQGEVHSTSAFGAAMP